MVLIKTSKLQNLNLFYSKPRMVQTQNFNLSKFHIFLFLLSSCCALILSPINAQQCSNTTISANTRKKPRLNSNDLINGFVESRYLTIHLNSAQNVYCRNWSMTAMAIDNWRSGNYEIDIRNTFIRFNTIVGGTNASQIGITSELIPISRSETSLVNKSKEPLDGTDYAAFDMQYDLSIRGGGDQLSNAPNGSYFNSLLVTLYDETGNVINSTIARLEFQINRNNSINTSIISLQNGASNIALGFNNASDIVSGVSDKKIDGLNVSATMAHQVIVKSATNRLLEISGNNQGIPTNIIELQLTPNKAAGITCPKINLSDEAKIVADNPMTNASYRSILYTLNFSIPGNSTVISSTKPGSYSTNIVFILVPK